MVDDIDREATREELYAMIDSLRRDVKLFRGVFKNAPDMPEPLALQRIGRFAKWPEDNERGKRVQNEIGLERVPPKSECESGAGLWDRITGGAWRQSI
jgi:hypothetical protein